jgi:hypothetical protein
VKHARFEETDPLDAPALADDVRDLHGAMKKLYSGYPELLQDRRFDVEAFFAKWERDVRAAGATIPFGAGVVEPLAELRHHIRDNHLGPWGWGSRLAARPSLAYSEYQTAERVDGLDTGACTLGGGIVPVPGTPRRAKVLTKKGVEEITTFSAQSTAPALEARCGDHAVRFDRRAASDRPSDKGAPVYDWRVVGDAAVITIRRLWGSPEEEKKLETIAADYDEHRKHPVVVFDFRGNGGGNDGYVWAWVEKAAHRRVPSPYVELRVTGAARSCGDWNNLVADQISFDRVDQADARAERDAFWKKTLAAPEEPSQVIGELFEDTTAKAPYKGRIFVLVNHASGSSGESAPSMLRVALGATVVGERTGGYAEFGNIRPYAMPRTGVMWQLASKRNYYDTPTDGVGHPVDLYLPPELVDAKVEDLLPLLEALPAKPR